MKNTLYVCLIALSALLLTACGDDNNLVGPAAAPTTAQLLVRKWIFASVSVATNAKTYAVPTKVTDGQLTGSNPLTFLKDGTVTSLDSAGKVITGKWTLTDKKLTLSDPRSATATTSYTIVTISTTDMQLSSNAVDVTKDRKAGDTKYYGPTDIAEEFISLIFGLAFGGVTTNYTRDEVGLGFLITSFLATTDKANGGTVDFTKEPPIKTVQYIINAKAQ
jgi:hypothetical protein